MDFGGLLVKPLFLRGGEKMGGEERGGEEEARK